MIIAVTGITGNMGQATLDALETVPGITKLKLLCNNEKRMRKLLKKHKTIRNKIEVIPGGMTQPALRRLVQGSDLVINMAAVIPPASDHFHERARLCNDVGVDILVSEIETAKPMPALVHISTVAVYGNRTGQPFVRVGDPLLASPLDVYSATKIRGEFHVLESNIEKWAILRQSAMLHPQMLAGNMSDPLMYHTVHAAPLEWSTAHDSGVLIGKIVKSYIDGTMPQRFWKKCFSIAGGAANRQYGMQTFDSGFAIIGGNMRDFFKPGDSATRNFHGGWFLDGDELNDMFPYIEQTPDDYWREIARTHPVFKLGKIAPKSLIRKFVFDKLKRNDNAPAYWAAHNDEARMIAYFGSREAYDKLQTASWQDVTLPDPAAIANITENPRPVEYGFDFDKPDAAITEADLAAVAAAHGGELLSSFGGDMYEKLKWRTQDGEEFEARPYTVLRVGHWFNPLYEKFVWDFDRLSKKYKIFASVWYDSHATDEDYVFSYTDDYIARVEKIGGEK